MEHRKLGEQGLEAAAVGFGTVGGTMAYGQGGEEASHIATLRKAHELGVTMFDTAELYRLGSGANERLVGRAVRGFRKEIVLATKFGFDMDDPTKRGRDSQFENLREVVEISLRFPDTEFLDVLYQH